MTTSNLPDIADLDSEQLLELRAAIDARLQAIRHELIEQAQRLGLAITDGTEKKRRGRRPKVQDAVREE